MRNSMMILAVTGALVLSGCSSSDSPEEAAPAGPDVEVDGSEQKGGQQESGSEGDVSFDLTMSADNATAPLPAGGTVILDFQDDNGERAVEVHYASDDYEGFKAFYDAWASENLAEGYLSQAVIEGAFIFWSGTDASGAEAAVTVTYKADQSVIAVVHTTKVA